MADEIVFWSDLNRDSNGDGLADGVFMTRHLDYVVTPLGIEDGAQKFTVERVAASGGWGGEVRIEVAGFAASEAVAGRVQFKFDPHGGSMAGAAILSSRDSSSLYLGTIKGVSVTTDGAWHDVVLEGGITRPNTARVWLELRAEHGAVGEIATVWVRRAQVNRGPIALAYYPDTVPRWRLPPSIEDERSRAILDLVERLGQIDLTPLLVYRIDSVPASALYALAWQFGVLGSAGWGLADTDAKRRDLLRRAILLHHRKGTVWAIKAALAAVGYPDAEVDEAAGGPFEFQVNLGTLEDDTEWSEEKQAALVAAVETWKNARSRLISVHSSPTSVSEPLARPVDDPMVINQTTRFRYDGTYAYDGAIAYSGQQTIGIGLV